MKNKILLAYFVFAYYMLNAQPAIQWQKTLGGKNDESINSIEQTTDGGYILAGYTASHNGDFTANHGEYDYWVVKLDAAENVQWQKLYGGSFADYAKSIEQTTDGGYIVAGYSFSADGDITGHHKDYDYWIIKLDASGNIKWQKSLGGKGDDHAASIQQTTDGGYIVAGYSNSADGDITAYHNGYDYWVVKLDASGNIKWQKSLGGKFDDYANRIQQTADGGYIVAGSTESNDGDVTNLHGEDFYPDFWIVKLDNSGILQWQKTLGGTASDEAASIKQTKDKGFIIAGSTNSNDDDVAGLHGNAFDYWIVKSDSLGNIEWQKALGGTSYDNATSVQQTIDDGYIVAGYTGSKDGDVTGIHGINYADGWIVKLDASGNIQWQKVLGGTSSDYTGSIQQIKDGGYVVAGSASSDNGDVTTNYGRVDGWIVKLAPDVLPITLLSFDGAIQSNEAILKWKTANELNNKGFEVQKSINGQTFTDIGFINGHGNSSQINNYIFTDVKVAGGSNYYRLKQIDNDNNFTYSSVIKLDNSKFNWYVSNNPSVNKSWVEVQLDKTSTVIIQVVSVNGKIMQTINKGNLDAGTYSVPLGLNNASHGVDIIRLIVNDKTYTTKIIK